MRCCIDTDVKILSKFVYMALAPQIESPKQPKILDEICTFSLVRMGPNSILKNSLEAQTVNWN